MFTPGWLSVLAQPVTLGTLCGLVSAVAYTAANICLRAVADCDPIWVSCVKSWPTAVLAGSWLVAGAFRGARILPQPRVLAGLLLAGFTGHLLGNVAFQWSLGIVGIALSVSLTLGTMIVSGALIGRLFLGESITPRACVSMLLLLGAIAALYVAAGEALDHDGAFWLSLLGVAAACLSGAAYSLLGAVIRFGVSGRASIGTTMFSIALVGMLSLGSISWLRIGFAGMQGTAPEDFRMMIIAGVWNFVAFLTLTKALQLTTLVYVNALNASQATMATLAGVVLFHEPSPPSLWVGVTLTVLGLALMSKRRTHSPSRDAELPVVEAGSCLAEESASAGLHVTASQSGGCRRPVHQAN